MQGFWNGTSSLKMANKILRMNTSGQPRETITRHFYIVVLCYLKDCVFGAHLKIVNNSPINTLPD